MKDIIETIISDIGNTYLLDEEIFDLINDEKFNSWEYFNAEALDSCFVRGFNRVLIKVLTECAGTALSNMWSNSFISDSSKSSLLFQNFNANQEVVIKLLGMYKDQISNNLTYSRHQTKFNLLHSLLNKGMDNAVRILLEDYDVTDLLFSADTHDGNVPLITAMERGAAKPTDTATNIWESMIESKNESKINEALTRINQRGNNILHACSKYRMYKLLPKICLGSDLDKKVIEKSLNQPNSDGWMPLESCRDEETALKIIAAFPGLDVNHVDIDGHNTLQKYALNDLKECVKKILEFNKNNQKRIREMLLHTNRYGNNPLMYCLVMESEKCLDFFLEYILTMDRNETNKTLIHKILHQQNCNGLTFLGIILEDEKSLQSVSKIISPLAKVAVDYVDLKGNNILHMFAKKNFLSCVRKIIDSMPDEKSLGKMLRSANNNGNNPLMSCIFKNSEKVLTFLLGYLLTKDENDGNKKLIYDILHQQNTKGETLLGLILQYQEGTQVPKTIAIELEKYCHTIINDKTQTLKKFTTCLRRHVDPSVEVLKAVKDVEDSYEKSLRGKVWTFITLLWTSFLMPLSIMVSDMTFDIILVIGYSCFLEYTLRCADEIGDCAAQNNSTNYMLSNLTQIPTELKTEPRFYYSLAFITLPWMFYSVEFFHSRHRVDMNRKVYICFVCKNCDIDT